MCLEWVECVRTLQSAWQFARTAARGESRGTWTYGVVRVDLLLLDRLAVGQTHDHPRGLLGVPSHSDVDAPRALRNERHKIQEGRLNIRAIVIVSVTLTDYMRLVDATHPFRPTICANRARCQQPNSRQSSRTGDYACFESRDDQCCAHESSRPKRRLKNEFLLTDLRHDRHLDREPVKRAALRYREPVHPARLRRQLDPERVRG